MELQNRKKGGILKWILWIVVGLLIIAVFVVLGLFRVRDVDVIGNDFYTPQQIEDMVMKGSLGENSLYLKWKYDKDNGADDLIFLNGVEITLLSPYHIQIRVYEKDIVGYLTYSGSFVYFDKDGIVVDISQELKEGVPAYSGITIGQPVEEEVLPVADEKFLEDIIEETALLQEIGVQPKQVHYDENQEMILYFAKDLRALMGKNTYMEDKMTNLLALFPKMEGLSGTLHMEDFTSGTSSITFKKNEKGEDELIFDIIGDGSDPAEKESEDLEDETDEEGNVIIPTDAEGKISTDGDGNSFYTDPLGNVTYNLEQLYLNDDGSLISDGYGYIDPYTGAYVMN